jgi:hypothetical protein
VGGCSNWQGYVSQVFTNGAPARVITRPQQDPGTYGSGNQDLLFGDMPFSVTGDGCFNGPAGTTVGSETSTLALAANGAYTWSYTITLTGSGAVTIANNLYSGVGVVILSTTNATSGGNTYTNFANAFDGLAIGTCSDDGVNPIMDISTITITKMIQTAPTITGLTNETVLAGTSPTLSPTVTGVPTPVYQWQLTNGVNGFTNLPWATSASLTLTNVQIAQNGYVYALIASNFVGAATNRMTLSVVTPTNSPHISSFSKTNLNVVISGTNGVNGGTYYLLESTNLTKPLSQWTPVATNVVSASGASGAFTFTGTNVITSGFRQQFYILSTNN